MMFAILKNAACRTMFWLLGLPAFCAVASASMAYILMCFLASMFFMEAGSSVSSSSSVHLQLSRKVPPSLSDEIMSYIVT